MVSFREGNPVSFDEKSNTPVTVQREDGVFRIARIRPEKRNCLSPRLVGALPAAIDEAAGSEDTGCLLLEQRGDVFGSGVNYTALAGGGGCAGAGLGLLLECHYMLAEQETPFALTGIHRAIWPGLCYGSLVRSLGPSRACELALTGRVFSTSDAASWRIVQQVVPAFDLEERELQVSAGLASLSPGAAGAEAGTLRGAWLAALDSPDFREALNAARERRKPRCRSRGPIRKKARG